MNSLPSPHGFIYSFILATLNQGLGVITERRKRSCPRGDPGFMEEGGRESQTQLAQSEYGRGRRGEGAKNTIWEEREHFLEKMKPKIRVIDY